MLEEVAQLDPVDNHNFVLVTDTRILDLRAWDPNSTESSDNEIVAYRRMRARRNPDAAGSEEIDGSSRNIFRFQQSRPDREMKVRCDATELRPRFRYMPTTLPEGGQGILAEAEFELSVVPVGRTVDIGFEIISSGLQGKVNSLPILQFPIVAETKVASMWVLLPENHHYDQFELLAFEKQTGNLVKVVEPTYSFDMADGTVFGWMLVDPNSDYLYECRWNLRSRQGRN